MQKLTEKEKLLKIRMRELKIYEKDIEESFIRSSGPGGQNVNKLSTCVYLLHRPTGLSVKYQKERSQALNRLKARQLLVDKIAKREKERILKEIQKKEKKRRQKRKRSKKAKEKMLEGKRFQSEKKSRRKKITNKDMHKYL